MIPAIAWPAAVLVIDLQGNGYQDDAERGIPLSPGFSSVVAHTVTLVEEARRLGIPVIFTMERHAPTLVDIGRELDGSEGIHCLAGDPATELLEELGLRPDEFLIKKRRYSAFFGTDLDIIARGLGVRTLIIAGALTDVCVHYSFVDAHQLDYHAFVVKECVIGSSEEGHAAALEAISYLQREAVVTLGAILESMKALSGQPVPNRSQA